jgi:hypothetical protein
MISGKFLARASAVMVAAGMFAALASPSIASDNIFMLPIADALASSTAQGKLDGSVQFFFGEQRHPGVKQKFGDFVSNKKTNGFNKSDLESCTISFVSALIQFQDRAHELGANAVVNIHSFYKKHDVSSETEIECHAGTMISGVTLKGDFVAVAGHR